MSALQTLIAAADGTTDEAAHVFVPVSAIRALADEPAHVAQAAMDEDIRAMAIHGARLSVRMHSWTSGIDGSKMAPYTDLNAMQQEHYDRALRVLRHFGLLVEHGDGVVSIKERT